MDKAEYRVMLDRITELADAGDYTNALPVVEKVDWRRVKSVRTLCMVSEVYEANDRLEDALRVLKIAYKRASISKTVLYRLSEISAKLGDSKGAINYYKEFEEISPMDNSKYILKYEIYRAKGNSLEDQIRVLEEYKEREYTEKWAYELAKLYSQAGMIHECVDTCDDLILWFNEGSYVLKAMELKKKYAPLTPSQSKKYEEQKAYKEEPIPKWETQSFDFESQIIANTESALNPKKEEEASYAEKPEVATYTVPEFEPAPIVEPIVQMDPSRMQNQLADSIRAVFSGINKETETFEPEEDEDINLFSAQETDMSDYEIKELEPDTVQEKPIIPVAASSEAVEDDQIEGQMSLNDYAKEEAFDLEALIAETTSSLAQEVASGEFEMTDEVLPQEEEKPSNEAILKSVEAAAAMAAEEVARKAAEEEARKAAEEAARKAAEEEARKAAEEEARKIAEEVARKAAEESQIHEKETDETLGLTREFNFNEELKKAATTEETEDLSVEEIDLENLEQLIQNNIAETADEVTTDTVTEVLSDPNSDILTKEIEREKLLIPYVPVEPRDMTEKEKDIFSYFTRIPGMSQQITETICDVHNNAGDKTSKSGNFLIIGRQGSGKTKLYESMVLAICNDLGIKAAKIAKIIGRDLNKKDVAAVVAKMAGGFLVIEGAGELSDESVAKLSQAMEFRTDGLIVVLEDEKEDLFAMLDRHPELSEKFTSSIKIPVFTNDELVTFAKTYASENGYKMDEMGVLALYTKIGDNQKNSEPVTVGKVKAIMDEAIAHANKGTRKLSRKFSKNAVDDDNRVLLLEKDFE